MEEYLLEEDETSLTYTGPVYLAESAAHCAIIRDIFGNPFRPVVFSPDWYTPTVISLAKAASGEGSQPSADLDPVRLGVLSDALEEAGCTDAAILDHLRSQGPHVRWCWAVDLILSHHR
jgi:hypothetical protein